MRAKNGYSTQNFVFMTHEHRDSSTFVFYNRVRNFK